ncbi:heterocyst frequency control protein PatD [Coleofasciculus sp. FACHB-1120]|uniref:heterocyst frequency control protein PatD n=1 Tax=Coleofasciculus sp. FACHB-1120 TaxID=2692783 RepID=UPI001A7EA08A|nr:heterocyst frequency control protein PatD [Coleofasciculus sp. FACHB-1120]
MLPQSYQQRYQELLTALEQLLHTITATHQEREAIAEKFQHVKQVFEQQITTLTGDELDPEIEPRWRSFQTEIYRALRLLEMDMTFLQASRRSATANPRQAAIGDRLSTLMSYCQALLQADGDRESTGEI